MYIQKKIMNLDVKSKVCFTFFLSNLIEVERLCAQCMYLCQYFYWDLLNGYELSFMHNTSSKSDKAKTNGARTVQWS